MSEARLPVGCFVRIDKKSGLQAIIGRLGDLGYRVIGPTVRDGAIVLDEVRDVEDLPIGILDAQEAGTYRLNDQGDGRFFDHVVGPCSIKSELFPPRMTVLEIDCGDDGWSIREPAPPPDPIAVIGLRGCDLHAIEIQDRVFLGDRFQNLDYAARRAGLFVLAVHCARAAATCFCDSMGTGPTASGKYDLALTEMPEHFVIEVGTEQGGVVAAAADWIPCNTREIAEAQEVPRQTEAELKARRTSPAGESGAGRHLDTTNIRDLLLNNLEHEEWDRVAGRCLACGNCTMVCPTCFCSTVQEVSNLTGDHVRRERVWDCCFTADHSYMNSGTVRKSTRARYRQWLTHKLASWIDQFGTSGCVGCGRCITWCPVGIDLTEEVAAIRGDTP